jgi:hypothetical protein
MRKLYFILTLAAVLMAVGQTAFAQSAITSTTLSSAMSDAKTSVMKVTSATGFTASNQATGAEYCVFVDHELMRISAVSGTTITVLPRGFSSTTATPHKSGSRAYVGPCGSQQGPGVGQSGGPFIQTSMQGACTRNQWAILPLINVNQRAIANPNGMLMYNCLNGSWRPQTMGADIEDDLIVAASNIPIGSVAYGSLGTNTTDVNNQMWITSITLPKTGLITGIQVLQGGTATTDTITAALYDGGGNLIAAGAAAGVALSGANTFLNIPFTSAALVTGPARYFIAVTGNGTAAGAIRTIATATYTNVVATTQSSTFGTFPAISPVPTTFTANDAPIVQLYY